MCVCVHVIWIIDPTVSADAIAWYRRRLKTLPGWGEEG